jgi:hypothetical protein
MARVGEPNAIARENVKKANNPTNPTTRVPHGAVRMLLNVDFLA